MSVQEKPVEDAMDGAAPLLVRVESILILKLVREPQLSLMGRMLVWM